MKQPRTLLFMTTISVIVIICPVVLRGTRSPELTELEQKARAQPTLRGAFTVAALVTIGTSLLTTAIGTRNLEPAFLLPIGRHPPLLMTTQLQPESSYRTLVAILLPPIATKAGEAISVPLSLFLSLIRTEHLLLLPLRAKLRVVGIEAYIDR